MACSTAQVTFSYVLYKTGRRTGTDSLSKQLRTFQSLGAGIAVFPTTSTLAFHNPVYDKINSEGYQILRSPSAVLLSP